MEEPLNLSTKSKTSEIDYDEACLVNCDKNGKGKEDESGEFSSNGDFNPNLLLQQQYFLLQQQQQQQQLDSLAKMHLDKYLKLTNRYLHTMSPFLQQFTPLVGQSPALSAQAAATAAASILLASQPHPASDDEERKSPESTPDSSPTSTVNESVRFFLHKIIEHNFIQQLQQQQQLNDLINNNNNHQSSTANGHNSKKSPASSVDESEEFYGGQHLRLPSPAGSATSNPKTFFDFLKNAAVVHNGNASQRSQQGFKRFKLIQ